MSDTATQNNVTIEDAGPSRKKLTFQVPAEVVDAKLETALATVMHEAQLPGFRKGRVPRRLIEKRFGDAVRNEAKNELVSSVYGDAVREHELKVIGNPEIGSFEDIEMTSGKPMNFAVEVEVLPEFDLPSLDGIKVRRPDATVPTELIDQEIEKVCINEGTLEELDTPAPGDYLTGHGVMTGDVKGETKTFHDIHGAVIRIPEKDSDGSGMILGVMVDDFAKQLGKAKPGDTVTLKVKGPENHEIEDVRGTDLTITFQVERADRIIPAEIADVVAKSGLQSEEQLRTAVGQRLEQRAVTQQRAVQHTQILKHLLDEVKVELPPRLSATQAARTLDRRRMELLYKGVDPAKIEENMAELRAMSAGQAVRELKTTFILAKAAEQLGIQVEEGEVNGAIVQMAAQNGISPDRLRNDLIQSNRISSLIQQVRDVKTLDAILANATIEDMSVEEFNKIMAEEYGKSSKA